MFGIDTTGKLYASSAEISGKITANSGSIAGWRIESTYLASGTATAPAANTLLLSPAGTSSSYTVAGTAKSGWMITAGTTFGVNKDGGVYAISGAIGNFTLSSGKLYSNNHSAWNTDADGIYMNSDGIAGGKKGIWYLWKDGSAKIGALTLSSAGVLAVPAANITGKLSADHIDASSLSIGQSQVDGLSTALTNAQNTANAALGQSVWYAECSTAAGTTAKVATITPTTTAFTLKAGATVNVTFTTTNSGAAGSITLNVNSTGAKNIKYINNNGIANIPGGGYIVGGRTYQFVYDGTYWVI